MVGYLSSEAKALVRALLEKDPKKRLGSGPHGNAAVKSHPFFRSINWEMLHARKVSGTVKLGPTVIDSGSTDYIQCHFSISHFMTTAHVCR